ncbi:MAG: hypothetical protein AB7J32_16310 [Pseudonocardia sp.]
MRTLIDLPATGFPLSCVPVEIHTSSAGRTRAVAILDEQPA